MSDTPDQSTDNLVVNHFDDRQEKVPIPLSEDTPIRVGRETDNDVVLSDPRASRYHAQLRRGEEGLQVGALEPVDAPGALLGHLRLRLVPALLELRIALRKRGGRALPDRLGLQVVVVVALVREKLAAIEFRDARRHPLQEVAVVGHEQAGPGGGGEILRQPGERPRIEMVGGLVEDEQIGLGQQGPAEADPALLSRES